MDKKEYQRLWYQRNKVRLAERRHAAWNTEEGREHQRAINRKYDTSNRGREVRRESDRNRRSSIKVRARDALRWAIRSGKVARGTCHCGKIGHGHHEDYSKPLEVIWLCREHHDELHMKKGDYDGTVSRIEC